MPDNDNANRIRLAHLIKRAGITQGEAANYIAEETKRPCSARAVRAWLAAPNKKSARPCPRWAVDNLEARLRYYKLI